MQACLSAVICVGRVTARNTTIRHHFHSSLRFNGEANYVWIATHYDKKCETDDASQLGDTSDAESSQVILKTIHTPLNCSQTKSQLRQSINNA